MNKTVIKQALFVAGVATVTMVLWGYLSKSTVPGLSTLAKYVTAQ
jgi:hypothetical protein